MKKIKILILALALSLVWGLNAPAYAQQSTVGILDMQKAINDSKPGQKAKKDLENRSKKMDNDMKTKQAELSKLAGELQKMQETRSGSQDEYRKKVEELEKKGNAMREQGLKYAEELQKAETSALEPLWNKAVKEAERIAKARGYVLVLDTRQAGVLFALPTMDITAEVTKALDK